MKLVGQNRNHVIFGFEYVRVLIAQKSFAIFCKYAVLFQRYQLWDVR